MIKFLPAQISYLLGRRDMRRNLRALFSFFVVLAVSIVILTLIFHALMRFEGQQHSWLTGFYWTLTVMSTLGLGDIAFESDLGRAFTLLVLTYGLLMLFLIAPFTFIRFFYAPWLEAQVHLTAPRELAPEITGHVVICRYDEIARALIPRLAAQGIPCVLIEPDGPRAAALHSDGLRVVVGAHEARATFEATRVCDARLVLANLSDAANTNVTLTIREVSPETPVIAFAEEVDSKDILELSGATQVVPLKQRLGQQLAIHVGAGTQTAHRIGRFGDLVIAEVPIHGTQLPGRSIRDTQLRELTGLNIVAVWERGRLLPAGPDTLLSEHSVPVVVGSEEQITELDALFVIYHATDAPVLVIGGGSVGRAVSQALRERGARVTILDRDAALGSELARVADQVVIGDAASLQTVKAAGIDEANSVVLTTNDDATNIFLAVYCRKLREAAHIVSRLTNDWNIEAIHRAGADFALSHAALAVQTLLSVISGRELIVIGADTELFIEPTPARLSGQSLAASRIGAETGLNVIALRERGRFQTNPPASTRLDPGSELVMLGSAEQRQRFLALSSRPAPSKGARL